MNKQTMAEYGFNYIGSCNCSGTLTEKYFDGRYTVTIKPRRRLFKVYLNNQTVVPLTNWVQLEEKLKRYARDKTF